MFLHHCFDCLCHFSIFLFFFFFNDTAPTEIYTLSLHDALPILLYQRVMANIARSSLALSVAAALSLPAANPARAHLVEDFGVRKGAPVHISLSTGFNGFVGAGIKKIQVDGVKMDAFCIDPFTMALRSSSGYRFVPLTKAPESPFTLRASEATEISDLWAMFYNPGMKENKAAGLQLAIWEI